MSAECTPRTARRGEELTSRAPRLSGEEAQGVTRGFLDAPARNTAAAQRIRRARDDLASRAELAEGARQTAIGETPDPRLRPWADTFPWGGSAGAVVVVLVLLLALLSRRRRAHPPRSRRSSEKNKTDVK